MTNIIDIHRCTLCYLNVNISASACEVSNGRKRENYMPRRGSRITKVNWVII